MTSPWSKGWGLIIKMATEQQSDCFFPWVCLIIPFALWMTKGEAAAAANRIQNPINTGDSSAGFFLDVWKCQEIKKLHGVSKSQVPNQSCNHFKIFLASFGNWPSPGTRPRFLLSVKGRTNLTELTTQLTFPQPHGLWDGRTWRFRKCLCLLLLCNTYGVARMLAMPWEVGMAFLRAGSRQGLKLCGTPCLNKSW